MPAFCAPPPCAAVGLTLAAFLQAVLGPLAALLLQLWAAVGGALLPALQLLRSLVAGPFLLLGSGLRQLGAAAGEMTPMFSALGWPARAC